MTVFLVVKWFPVYTGKISYSTEKAVLYRKAILTHVDKMLAVAWQILDTSGSDSVVGLLSQIVFKLFHELLFLSKMG